MLNKIYNINMSFEPVDFTHLEHLDSVNSPDTTQQNDDTNINQQNDNIPKQNDNTNTNQQNDNTNQQNDNTNQQNDNTKIIQKEPIKQIINHEPEKDELFDNHQITTKFYKRYVAYDVLMAKYDKIEQPKLYKIYDYYDIPHQIKYKKKFN
jgi:hypothetical protein